MRQLFEKIYSWQLNLLLEDSLPFTACESRGEYTADGPRKNMVYNLLLSAFILQTV